eukprot:TRINITY_DN20871_c0_g1_i2.p1 TRINITY_DN20871_c0_g1~~TRINITY_DN20871_c0_g1_i2.p1  ORF type:complete len:570 (+),score=137.10 TRINITY_DN20871_c0_g1_i2:78-1787(+)
MEQVRIGSMVKVLDVGGELSGWWNEGTEVVGSVGIVLREYQHLPQDVLRCVCQKEELVMPSWALSGSQVKKLSELMDQIKRKEANGIYAPAFVLRYQSITLTDVRAVPPNFCVTSYLVRSAANRCFWFSAVNVKPLRPSADWILPDTNAPAPPPISFSPSPAYSSLLFSITSEGPVDNRTREVFQSPSTKRRRTEVRAANCLVNPSTVLRLIHKAGEGTYGEVHRGENITNGIYYAVKRIRDEQDSDKDPERRRGLQTTTLRELSTLACLSRECPHIVRLMQTVVGVNGHVYALFEWVANDLSGVISAANQKGGLEMKTARSLAHQALTGIAYLHSLGLVHRDLKPSNILLGSDGIVKLCDFGFVNAQNDHARTPTICTPSYRPPEVMLGTLRHRGSLDMWGYGVLLYKLMGGQALFKGTTDLAILQSMVQVLGTPLETAPHPQIEWPYLYKDVNACTAFERCDLKAVPFDQRALPKMLANRFKNDGNNEGPDIMEKLLYWDPDKRITAQEALKHPFFAPSRVYHLTDVIKTDGSGTSGVLLANGRVLELTNLHVFLLRNPEAKFERKI